MQKKKAIIALLVILAMVLAIIPFKAFATGESYTITFTVSSDAEGYHDGQTDTDVAHSVEIAQGHLKIDGQFVDPRLVSAPYDNTFNGYTVQQTGANTVEMTITNGEAVVLDFNTANNYMLKIGEQNVSAHGTEFSANSNVQVFDYVAPQQGSQPGEGEDPEQPNFDSTAKLIVRGGTGSYTDRHYNPETNSEEEVQVPYAESYINGAFSVNDSYVRSLEAEPGHENDPVPESKEINLDYNKRNDGKITINFGSLFIYKYVGKVVVNETEYDIPFNYADREAWLDHYDFQGISFGIEVPEAANNTYDVVVKIEPAEQVFIGNFLWTSNPDEEYFKDPEGQPIEINDNFIAHSKIEFVKVKYQRNGTTYTKRLEDLNNLGENQMGGEGESTTWTNYTSGDNGVEFGKLTKVNNSPVNYDEGSMVLAEGAEVTLRIIPEYGYQVTAFTINGQDLIIGDNISEFTFIVREGNAHIGARVTAVEDDVKSTAAAIKGGEVIIPEGTLETGTARLSVSEANVSEAKQEAFEEQAGNGYEINSIFNMNLDQVFYKGNNGSDVWNGEELEDLDEAAVVGLALEEEIDPTNSVIVHNIHDGEEFETIDIRGYDPETNSVYFPATSFSNYAIATKVSATDTETKKDDDSEESSSEKADSVKTGDKIMIFVGTFLVATIALVVTKKSKRNRKVSRH